MKFLCPESMKRHVQGVFAGQYDIADLPAPPKVVLDIGANLGSFTVWAARKWPLATIHAYEPHPDTFAMLDQNVAPLRGPDHTTMLACDIRISQRAVYADGELDFYPGLPNCGCASLWKGEEQRPVPMRVQGISPTKLPPCDFMKIDTEGSELGILLGYPHLDKVTAVALEYHSPRDQRMLVAILEDAGLRTQVEAHGRVYDLAQPPRADRGIIRALREKLAA